MNINDLTLEEKVGQMLMFAFHGIEYKNNEQLNKLINELKVGGIIHFSRNLINPEQACNLNYEMNKEAKIPLFIGIDQEGGIVQRIIKDCTPFPGAMALAATQESNEELCYYVGNDLKNMNFNMVFAPVADVNNNPLNPVINSRSYSDDPEICAKYVISAVKGFQKALVLPTIKHFPGHGDTTVDSHISLPTVNKDYDQLNKIELIPFKKAIEEGCAGVMVSHIVYPAFDKKYPATLSYNIMTKYLQEKLHFEGLIVSDSLTMGAINNNYTKQEIVTLACNGGMDLLIFCGRADYNEQKEIYEAFLNGVKQGLISIERVNKSVSKILRLKEKYCTNWKKQYLYPTDEAIALGTYLSQKSISLVMDKNLLPIKGKESILVIFPKIKLFTLVDNNVNNDEYKTLGSILERKGLIVKEIIIDENLELINEIKDSIANYSKIIMATYNVTKNDYQTKVYSLLDKSKTIVVAMRSPYDIRLLNIKNDLLTYICTYEATDLALNSLAKALTGEIKFKGKIPVKVK